MSNRTTSRNGDAFERLGWYHAIDPELTFLCNYRRALSPVYAAAEFLWYMTRDPSVEMIKAYAPKYVQFAESDGRVFGAYGARMHNGMELVVDLLSQHSDTRQAVISLWHPDDLLEACTQSRRDLPCTLSWQFLLRERKLFMITNMRSNDVWLGMPYDIFVNTCIMRIIAAELGVELGAYIHQAGSMHLYESNYQAAREADMCRATQHTLPHNWTERDGLAAIKYALELERRMRSGENFDLVTEPDFKLLGHMLRDLVLCVAERWYGDRYRVFITSAALRAGLIKDVNR